jgi:hypothetical protein
VVWSVATIKDSIQTKDVAVKNALLRVYGWQTDGEQSAGTTTDANGVGFNGADSFILSSFAEQLKTKGYLSPKQMEIARKKMSKYSVQIFNYLVSKHSN